MHKLQALDYPLWQTNRPLNFSFTFLNIFMLAITNEDWFGFPVYRYKQQNAIQYGTEFSIILKPLSNMQTGISYSGMNSKTQDGNFTPYIPAQKITPNINYTIKTKDNSILNIFTNADYCFAQNNTAPYEIATPSYWLWNMGISAIITNKSKTYSINISGNNLLNTAYYDHLSRFKYFGLLNLGRNIALNFKIQFDKQPIRK